MSSTPAAAGKTRTEGAVKGGEGRVVFFAVKNLSHGIIGMAADGTRAGGHYDPGFEGNR